MSDRSGVPSDRPGEIRPDVSDLGCRSLGTIGRRTRFPVDRLSGV